MSASLAARALNANPGTATLLFDVASAIGSGAPVGPPARFDFMNASIRANFGTSTSPPGPPPAAGSLPSNFQVVETISGSLCGNVTVESLSVIPVPQIFTPTGTGLPCSASCSGSHAYTQCSGSTVDTSCNSLLDVIVGGCSVSSQCNPIIPATQPDAGISGAPATLTAGAGNKVPTSQTAGNHDGYSSYFSFSAKRAHATGMQ